MKESRQYQLIASLFCAQDTQKKLIAKLKQYIAQSFQILTKLKSNEILLFGYGLKQSQATVVATENPSWKLRAHLLLTRKPVEKLRCAKLMPLRNVQEKLTIDFDNELNFLITGNDTLIFSAKKEGINTIGYWADTKKGCESIIRQYSGLSGAISHVNRNLRHIPSILTYSHSGDSEALLQVTKIAHDQETKKYSADIWLESVRLANYTDCIFRSADEESDFPALLTQKVTAAFDGADLVLISEIGILLEKWQKVRKPKKIPIHGDLWHGNALFDEQKNVCGVIDWEWFSENGIPGFDAIHCLIISHAMLKKQSVFRTIRMICTSDESDKPLLNAINDFAAVHLFDFRDIGAIVCLVWLTVIYRSHVYTGPRSAQWLSDAIRETTPFLLKSLVHYD